VASRGCNPLYAKDIDVLVPNVAQGSNHCIRTELLKSAKAKSPTAFDAELDNSELGEDGDGANKMQLTPMQKAYEGYSTRKIIMEERNVFCGAFNVMVLADQ
jgi:F-box/WD-40 domain protein 10